MKFKPTRCTVTQDGHEVFPGDTVYVTVNGGPFEQKKIKTCYAKKIEYTESDSGGYTGARYTVIYKEPALYVWHLVRTPYWHAPYWMNDGGMHWLSVGGSRIRKSKMDEVYDAGYGQYGDLDHTKTGLAPKKSVAGWLSRAGRFWPCHCEEHQEFASRILHNTAIKLETRGWVRVHHRKDWHCAKDLSEAQVQWMVEHGFDPDEYNPIATGIKGR